MGGGVWGGAHCWHGGQGAAPGEVGRSSPIAGGQALSSPWSGAVAWCSGPVLPGGRCGRAQRRHPRQCSWCRMSSRRHHLPWACPSRHPHAASTTERSGAPSPRKLAVHVAHPLESSARAPQMQIGPCVDRCTASQAGDDSERALLMPAPVQHLTAHKERQPPARRSTQRSGRPRGEPGKSSRPHTRPGTSQQAPG